MFGKRRDQDGGGRLPPEIPPGPGTAARGPETRGPETRASDASPRLYRPDTAPGVRPPLAEPPRRTAEVTATTGLRTDVQPASPTDHEAKKLIVGREIALSGEIRACDKLVVEGRVEAVLSESRAIEVSASGVFKGKAHIESAEISGVFEGELVTTEKLIIHATGRVYGNIRYGQIEIARGGVIAGQIDVLASHPEGAAVPEMPSDAGALATDAIAGSPEAH